jgi:hypothetical protein
MNFRLAFLWVLLCVMWASLSLSAQKNAGQFPKCTDSLSTVAVPSQPHGLFAIMFPHAQRLNDMAEQYLLHNPVVCGANFYAVWGEIDRGPNASPRYDFSHVENEMKPWIKAGKTVNIVTWATGYSGDVSATPGYVMSKAPGVECEHFGRVPQFWHKEFMANYQAFMQAVVQHFGNNPNVGYIRFGLGGGGETMPPCFFVFKNQMGLSPGQWQKYVSEMVDFEKSLNSPKTLMVGLNVFPGPRQDLEFPGAIARRAIDNGFAIGFQGWSMDDVRSDQARQPCGVDLCRIARQAAGKVAIEFQTFKQSVPDGSGRVGSLVDLFPAAFRLKAQIFEIYLQDFYIAYNPQWPEYGQYHQQYQRAFEDAARVVGGQ